MRFHEHVRRGASGLWKILNTPISFAPRRRARPVKHEPGIRQIRTQSIEGIHYVDEKDCVLSCHLPSNWGGVVAERIKMIHMEAPEVRDRKLREAEARKEPSLDDIVFSFGRAKKGGTRTSAIKIETDAYFSNMPHWRVSIFHDVFANAPHEIDFRKYKSTGDESVMEFQNDFSRFEEKGLQILRFIDDKRATGGEQIIVVRARVSLSSGNRPELVSIDYVRGEDGIHRIQAIDFNPLAIERGKSVVYSREFYDLMENARASALSDIKKAGAR